MKRGIKSTIVLGALFLALPLYAQSAIAFRGGLASSNIGFSDLMVGENLLARNLDYSHSRDTMAHVELATKEPVLGGVDGMPVPLPGRKSPGLAWLLSFIHPGIGQFYNKQIGKGVTMLSLAVVGEVLIVGGEAYRTCITSYYGSYNCHQDLVTGLDIVGGLLLVSSSIWSQVDAPISAAKINRDLGIASARLQPRLVALHRTPLGPLPGTLSWRGPPAPQLGLSLVSVRF